MTALVVDSSALIAILQGEPEAERLVAAITRSGGAVVGAPTLVEAHAVITARRGPAAAVALDALLQSLAIDVVQMSAVASTFARSAWTKFGKATGNPAALNFGDCLAYGVAAAEGAPLLFKGGDFAATDVIAAPW